MDLAIFVVTSAALIVAIYFGWRQAAKATLDYEVTYVRPLLGPRERLSEAFSVSWVGGNPPDVNVFAMKVGNYGRAPIKAEDFHTPLEIGVGDAYLLEVLMSESSPPSLSVDVSTLERGEGGVDRAIQIQPLLLNPGDWFEIQAYTNGAVESPIVSGRVTGISEFRDRVRYRDRRGRTLNIVGPLVALGLGFWVWGLTAASGSSLGLADILPVAIGAAVGIAVGVANARRP